MTHHRVRYPCAACGAPMPVERVLPVCEGCMEEWAKDDEERWSYMVIRLTHSVSVQPVVDGLALTEAFRAAKLAAGWDA